MNQRKAVKHALSKINSRRNNKSINESLKRFIKKTNAKYEIGVISADKLKTTGKVNREKINLIKRQISENRKTNNISRVVISKDGYIIEGHNRYAALSELNERAMIPVVKLSLSKKQLIEFFNRDEISDPAFDHFKNKSSVIGVLKADMKQLGIKFGKPVTLKLMSDTNLSDIWVSSFIPKELKDLKPGQTFTFVVNDDFTVTFLKPKRSSTKYPHNYLSTFLNQTLSRAGSFVLVK